jgi:hypothetical protein
VVFREHVLRTLDEKNRLAGQVLEGWQLDAFREFCRLWRDYYLWDREDRLWEYLSQPFEVRRAKYDRFLVELSSWDVSLRYPSRPRAGPNHFDRDSAASFRQRYEEQKRKDRTRAEAFERMRNAINERSYVWSLPYDIQRSLEVMGLRTTASLREIKQKYRVLARRFHPDVKGDGHRMSEINLAYGKLRSFFRKD